MESLSKTLEAYFGETFGEQAHLESGRNDADSLPIFIGQAYDMKRMTFLGRVVTLFFPKPELQKPTPTEVQTHITSIRNPEAAVMYRTRAGMYRFQVQEYGSAEDRDRFGRA